MSIEKNKTLFILDWDDTLFPTSWYSQLLSSNVHYSCNTVYKLMSIDNSLSMLLKKIKKYGKVNIISNACFEWLESSINLLPQTKNEMNEIHIISARDKYQYTTKIENWKKKAFVKSALNSSNISNIICIGDTDYELWGLKAIHKISNKSCYYKYVKLLSYPKYINVLTQLDILSDAIKYISQKEENLHLDIIKIE